MITVDQFLKALAIVESSDNPEAWGDAGRAMGRWQIHPERFWYECRVRSLLPIRGETWDQVTARILLAIWSFYFNENAPEEIAMYWHLGHWTDATKPDWDAKYAVKFMAALANAIAEMP